LEEIKVEEGIHAVQGYRIRVEVLATFPGYLEGQKD
jgi:hypothetical protein